MGNMGGLFKGLGIRDKRKKARKKIIKLADYKKKDMGVAALSVLLVACIVVGCLNNSDRNKKAESWKGIRNIAVMGVNQNEGHVDSAMIVSVDGSKGKCSILSVPRDTQIKLDAEQEKMLSGMGRKYDDVMKLSEAAITDQIEGASGFNEKLLEKVTHLKIDHYVLINMQSAAQLIDELGGLEIEVPVVMRYKDHAQDLQIDLEEGQQHLTGEEVLQMIRYRRYPEGDIGRIKTTQSAVEAVMEKVLMLPDAQAVKKMAGKAKEAVQTDLTLSEMTNSFKLFKKLKIEESDFYILPGEAAVEGNRTYYVIDESEAEKLVQPFIK